MISNEGLTTFALRRGQVYKPSCLFWLRFSFNTIAGKHMLSLLPFFWQFTNINISCEKIGSEDKDAVMSHAESNSGLAANLI